MSDAHALRRRRVLGIAAGTLAAGSASGLIAGCAPGPTIDRGLSFASLDDALRELDRLGKASSLRSGTVWTWPQTLIHGAQSIEYAMTGFPEMRSAVFRRTLGAAAFGVFSWRGRMSHDLAESIPGAPALATNVDAASAIARLQRSVQDFRKHTDRLHPHFAYGALSKSEYELANAMHLANHFSAFEPKA